jgi:hypothetical protein
LAEPLSHQLYAGCSSVSVKPQRNGGCIAGRSDSPRLTLTEQIVCYRHSAWPAVADRVIFVSNENMAAMPALRRRTRRYFGVILAAGRLSACASLTVADTIALPTAAMVRSDSDRISCEGYCLEEAIAPLDTYYVLSMVAPYTGDKRSASFAYCALTGMAR